MDSASMLYILHYAVLPHIASKLVSKFTPALSMAVLNIRNLTIVFMTPEGPVKAVDHVIITLSEGEICGLIGESDSGKNLIVKVICGVTHDNWRVTADRLRFDDIDLLALTPRGRRKVAGNNVSMIFQEPQSCLDPSERIGRQIIQAIPGWTYKG